MQMYILDIFFPPLPEEKYAIEAKISKVTSPWIKSTLLFISFFSASYFVSQPYETMCNKAFIYDSTGTTYWLVPLFMASVQLRTHLLILTHMSEHVACECRH